MLWSGARQSLDLDLAQKETYRVSSTAPADPDELSVTTVSDCVSSIGSPVIVLTSLVHPRQADELCESEPALYFSLLLSRSCHFASLLRSCAEIQIADASALRWFSHSPIHTCIFALKPNPLDAVHNQ